MTNQFKTGQQASAQVVSLSANPLAGIYLPGKVKAAADAALLRSLGIAVGDSLEVRITGMDSRGFYRVEPVTRTKQKASGGWSTQKIGHRQAVSALKGLYQFYNEKCRSLEENDRQLADRRKENQNRYQQAAAQADSTLSAEKQSIEQEYQNNLQRHRPLLESARRISDLSLDFVSTVKRLIPSEEAQARTNQAQVQTGQKSLEASEENWKRSCQNFRDARISYAEGVCSDSKKQSRNAQIQQDDAAERAHQQKRADLLREGRQVVSQRFHRDMLSDYDGKVRAARIRGDNFTCAGALPEAVMLGTLSLYLPMQGANQMSVAKTVNSQAADWADHGSDSYRVELPYCQRLEDGISVMIGCGEQERAQGIRMLEDMLVNLFLALPPGKLEATMVDPLSLGSSFNEIHDLTVCKEQKRLIDTRVWCKESDIEKALVTLRQKMEYITQNYGSDLESRMKKEPVKVLAIADFPHGFNETALKDLHAIVRNGARLGVFVLIAANEPELEKLRNRHATLLDEIAGKMVYTTLQNGALHLKHKSCPALYLTPDPLADVAANRSAVYQTFRSALEHIVPVEVRFEDMYGFDICDSNYWFTGVQREVDIPIGIQGARKVVPMVLGQGSIAHHALIAGKTGAGKSTLLQTLIMSTMLCDSPEQVQMYLLDFKYSVEFNCYARYRLPSLRVAAINSEHEFGLRVLQELCQEMEKRSQQFHRCGCQDITDYNRHTGTARLPRLLLIFDEVQELFAQSPDRDPIAGQCLDCIGKLVLQGRAMGIHLILACQNFRNCSGLSSYFSQFAVRIAVKGSEVDASAILEFGKAGVNVLENDPPGSAIYNDNCGAEASNEKFQVAILHAKQRQKLLQAMHRYYREPSVAAIYKGCRTRVMLTNAEDNIHHPFNRLIRHGAGTLYPISEQGWGIALGQSYGKENVFRTEFLGEKGDNLLVVTKNLSMAMSIGVFSCMSLFYESLRKQKNSKRNLIYVVDLHQEDLGEQDCDFETLGKCFNGRLQTVGNKNMEGLIDFCYTAMENRLADPNEPRDPLFLIFFGINRAHRLAGGGIYGSYNQGLSPAEKLVELLRKGPQIGITGIFLTESLAGAEAVLGDGVQKYFRKCIAAGVSDQDFLKLVSESSPEMVRNGTAVYLDKVNDIVNTHFRPYEVPQIPWVQDFARACRDAAQGGNGK